MTVAKNEYEILRQLFIKNNQRVKHIAEKLNEPVFKIERLSKQMKQIKLLEIIEVEEHGDNTLQITPEGQHAFKMFSVEKAVVLLKNATYRFYYPQSTILNMYQ